MRVRHNPFGDNKLNSIPPVRRRLPSIRICLVLAVAAAMASSNNAPLQAADPTFVGNLAYAVDDEGSKRLGLSDEVKQKLVDLIDRLESEALQLALELKDLPKPEITARLAPFVAKAEELGGALLNDDQRKVLGQMGLARRGMTSLSEDTMSADLKLSDEQRSQIQALIAERDTKLAQGGEAERRATTQDYERKLAAVLTEAQRANWEYMAGMRDAPAVPEAAPAVAATNNEPAASEEPMPASEATAQAPQQPAAGDDFVQPTMKDDAEPAKAKVVEATQTAEPPAEVKLRFNFVHQPWSDVLTWFADEADLSLQMDAPPAGTFNYRDSRSYTPAEAVDLMNRVLLLKGMTLVRSERLLTLMNLEDEIPPQLVEFVDLDELDERGSFEFVKCLFHLTKMDTASAEEEINKMIGPQGKVIALPTASQLLVTETAGKLRTIRQMIDRVENPDRDRAQNILEIKLKYVGPEEVLAIARPLLSIEEDANSNDKIRIAIDPFSSRLFATGDRDQLRQLEEIIPMVDREAQVGDGATVGALEQPQLMTYPVSKADPAQVLQVLQTLLAGLPDVRLAIDPITNKVVALARPTEHATIVATLKQLEGDADQIEVIQLRKMDPQLVILSINKLFGMDGEEGAADGPKIDGDPITMKLWVRGSAAQIAQVKELVEALEGPQAEGDALRQNIRVLPLSGGAASSLLDNMELFWPTMRDNKIRRVTPSAIGSTLRERRLATPTEPERPQSYDAPQDLRPDPEQATPPQAVPPEAPKPAPKAEQPPNPANASESPTSRFTFTTLQQSDAEAAPQTTTRQPQLSNDIIVSITPSGLVIASNDLDALDDFEKLLGTFTDQSALLGSEPTVYWLKYVKADVAAETLNQIVNGASASGGGGSLLGDVASSMLGDVGGGMLGGLIGGSDSFIAGSASIIPDVRLNALIVQAAPTDLSLIDRLLPIIDREASPEDVQTDGKPRLIPVLYMDAEQMSTIVKQMFPDRIAGAAAGGRQQQQQQASPADFINALRGGGGGGRGGRGGGQGAEAEPAKMAIGVDPRSNSLIVAAPEPLFREVQLLVQQLDQEGLESDDAMDVVTINYGNPESVHAALQALIGEQIKTSSPSSSSTGGTASAATPGGGAPPGAEDIQRRIEAFRALRGGGGSPFGGGGAGGSPFGGRGGGSPFGGGGGRGGGGPGGGGGRGR